MHTVDDVVHVVTGEDGITCEGNDGSERPVWMNLYKIAEKTIYVVLLESEHLRRLKTRLNGVWEVLGSFFVNNAAYLRLGQKVSNYWRKIANTLDGSQNVQQ